MKLLRIGNLGHEKPAIIDKKGSFRDLSSIINDVDSLNINQKTLNKIRELDLTKLPEFSKNNRIGACIFKPEKFIGIGLNYSAHAKETNVKAPKDL